MPQPAYKRVANVPTAIFRAYDIRGIVENILTPDVVYTIGLAIGSLALSQNERQVLTGRDGRLSAPLLYPALNQGLLDSGCDVLALGSVPTPLLYFATQTLSAHSGVMLTGSHNPAEYNGLKIVIGQNTLTEQAIQGLLERIQKQDFTSGQGQLSQYDIVPAYLDRICSDVKLQRPLKVVIDAGNGIAGEIGPDLLKKLGCEVIELYCSIDGRFPNHHPDPTIEKNLKDLIQTVKENHADIGLAFDGDADRLGVVTNRGEIIWPDRQMILFAQDVLLRNPGGTIIYDVKCTRHLDTCIRAANGIPLMWRTGHSLIKAKLKETKALLAGEMSGHIFFNERWYGFDDGLYTAARLLEIIASQPRSSHEVFTAIPNSINTPELKINMPDAQKFNFVQELCTKADFDGGAVCTIDGLRVDFTDGWGLVRASNTTPCLVLRFEADNQDGLIRIQEQFRKLFLAARPDLELPF